MTTRREFLRIAISHAALAAGAGSLAACAASDGAALVPTQWIEIGSDGRIVFMLDKTEMGQGVSTALPLIMAEELGVEMKDVEVRRAQPDERFTNMGTSGSGSITRGWRAHRLAAAQTRAVLVAAAAAAWKVPESECETRQSEVWHSSGRHKPFRRLVARARELPVPAAPPFRPVRDFRAIGTSPRDPELRAIVRGEGVYGMDHRVPGMKFAVLARPPRAGLTLGTANRDAALAVEGVRQVVQAGNALAVVADHTWAAMRGRDALAVAWTGDGNAGFDSSNTFALLEDAMRRRAKVARQERRVVGETASRELQQEYRWTWQAHAALEPLNCTAHARADRCEIWVGTQDPNDAQQLVARALGIPPASVSVHVLRMGGAFGRRIAVDYAVEAALVSRAAGAPVQVVWTREDDLAHDFFNPAQLNRLTAAITSRGDVVQWRHQVADFHLSMFGGFDATQDPSTSGDPWGGYDTPYDVPGVRVELAMTESPVATGAWRAVTYPAATMARECFVDELAQLLGKDPVRLRLDLIRSPAPVMRGDMAIDNGARLKAVLEEAARRGNWGAPPPASRSGGRTGRGIACNPYHSGTMVAQVAEVEVADDGQVRVTRVVSVIDCGVVIHTDGAHKQVEGGVAWALSALLGPGITFRDGQPTATNFGEYPILRAADAPELETHFIGSVPRPFGLGEPPVPAVAPAVLNAIHAATGVRLRSLPLDLQSLRRVV